MFLNSHYNYFMKILITGCLGLIGGEATKYYLSKGHEVVGIDNDSRSKYFGADGSVSKNVARFKKNQNFYLHDCDIANREQIDFIMLNELPDVVIHCAAQPSHDLAAKIPFRDFDTNVVGTVNLLECTRRRRNDAVFVHMSTNKVYGDNPNKLKFVELEKRYDYADGRYGIDESMNVDDCIHSLFGAGKLAGDVYVQEYGRYFGMKTCTLRGGCLTGPSHSGVELHGFMSYLVKQCVKRGDYTVIGYKGKQVRDQIHSYDVVTAIDAFVNDPDCGEVYNIGGERENSASVLECIDLVQESAKMNFSNISRNQVPRVGDHICYITDMSKFSVRYPMWEKRYGLTDIINEMVEIEKRSL